MKSLKNGHGFTLIELAVVLVILGIIAAVAIPRVASLMADARLAAANSELAAVHTAVQAYIMNDHPTAVEFSTNDNTAISPYISGGIGSLKGVYWFFSKDGFLDESNGKEPVYYTSTGHTQIDPNITYDTTTHQFVLKK